MNGNLGGQTARDQWEAARTEFAPYRSQFNAAWRAQVPVASTTVYPGQLWKSFAASSMFSTDVAVQREDIKGARWPLPSQREGGSSLDYLEDQMAAFVAEHKALVQDLRKHFQIPTDSSVTNFLNDHSSILQLLMEAKKHLEDCFGSSTVFALRAELDESGSRTLYASAIWSGKLQDARNALDKFDNDWWMSHARQAGGYLTFTYELV
jgi:hypothetical protein